MDEQRKQAILAIIDSVRTGEVSNEVKELFSKEFTKIATSVVQETYNDQEKKNLK